jgi:hypothetical protein
MPEIDVSISWGEPRALNVTQAQVGTLIEAGRVRLLGWSLQYLTGVGGANAVFQSGQTVVGAPAMGQNLSDTQRLPGNGVVCPQGLTLASVFGTFTGCVYVAYPDLSPESPCSLM